MQASPQALQLAALLVRSISHPLAATPSQSPKPVAQVAIVQLPAVHAAVALGIVHPCPHDPQLVALVPMFTSQPLAGLPSQSA